jgi:hypothetical protein
MEFLKQQSMNHARQDDREIRLFKIAALRKRKIEEKIGKST